MTDRHTQRQPVIKGSVGEIEYGYQPARPNRWFIRDRRDGVIRFLGPRGNNLNAAFNAARREAA